jgi:hypothetical protein
VIDPDIRRSDVRVVAIGARVDKGPGLGSQCAGGWRGLREQAVFDTKGVRAHDWPWTAKLIGNCEPNGKTLVMREIQKVPARGIIQPGRRCNQGRAVYVASQFGMGIDADERFIVKIVEAKHFQRADPVAYRGVG